MFGLKSLRFLKQVSEARARIREVQPDQVKAWLDAGEPITLIDVRSGQQWAESRLPGALHIRKDDVEYDTPGFVPDRDALVVCYCVVGMTSAIAADMLQRIGYMRVVSMDGGIKAWNLAGYPVESGTNDRRA